MYRPTVVHTSVYTVLMCTVVLTSAYNGSGSIIVACDFEDVNICGYTQDPHADVNWTRLSGPTPSNPTGPDFDHTFMTSTGIVQLPTAVVS